MATRTEVRKTLTKLLRDIESVEREVMAFTNGDMPEIVGTKEAAEILGWPRQRVAQQLHRGTFPAEPVVTLACGPIWRRDDIEVLV
jgi:hypothetical protein